MVFASFLELIAATTFFAVVSVCYDMLATKKSYIAILKHWVVVYAVATIASVVFWCMTLLA